MLKFSFLEFPGLRRRKESRTPFHMALKAAAAAVSPFCCVGIEAVPGGAR